jgi:hypothetical protein
MANSDGPHRAIERIAPGRFLSAERPKDVWRAALRQAVGSEGQRLWRTLLDIAEGRAWQPELPDGRLGPPQTPSAADRVAAATYLANTLFGRPVDQTQIVEAERAANEHAALQALTDAELLEEARRVVEGSAIVHPAEEEKP